MSNPNRTQDPHPRRPGAAVDVDLLGLGFGPSNMALAIAVEEHNAIAADPLRAVFHERQATSRWHDGMLFDDAHMQVAFAKDLVTLRNPTSDYAFLAFLHEQGRLVDFLNRGSLTPLRVEFAAYLRWAAARLGGVARYGSTVESVAPVRDGGRVVAFDVTVRDAQGPTTTRARDVVVAAGLQPRLPEGVVESARVWHNHRHLDRVALVDHEVRRAVVVGAGQSAAEVMLDLYARFPGAEVRSVSRRFGFSPSDSTPYANGVFDPGTVDVFYDAPPAGRAQIVAHHRNTNYSVVAEETIRALHEHEYRDRWLGTERLGWHRCTEVLDLRDVPGDRVTLTLADNLTETTTRLDADLVVVATGYRPLDVTTLLTGAGPDDRALVVRDTAGAPDLHRDHRARLAEPSDAGLYLVGQSEHSHGLSSTLLSTLGVRAGEVLGSVLARRAALGAGEPADAAVTASEHARPEPVGAR
ncbi:lysine N(6)-hydroxylase/L-ornithine N(5)-oxygenase family protein [Cellulosimicrobium protaetiae]|uniref:L-lysine N6-monooxygenase MbtG n=1 Tax=Cellulosimicrobium protaetiae TaxID=2587808 RepID=A0A6M5UF44_9MICO|nr:SidA/IucD/PvdA family monooxygenase [Cellulosimicrobium protaetiae]QJW35853.1 lysine N(6)-hydroxylase/L-ornithine N(5)-oxygenase family protein [Cellulosimicrobium protaetiae]